MELLGGRRRRRSPAINRGYLSRMVAVENSLEKYLLICNSLGVPHQVLSLGAGFDTLYFRLRNEGVVKPSVCHFFEVDYPRVPPAKFGLIRRHSALNSLFRTATSHFDGECFCLDDADFALVGCDLADVDKLSHRLEALGFDFRAGGGRLTLVLAECSLTYVEDSKVTSIASWLTESLGGGAFVFVDYEQIRPQDAFGSVMKRHFESRNCPLKCLDRYPGVEDHRLRFARWGWDRPQHPAAVATIGDLFRFFRLTSESLRFRAIGEQFDEPEEFFLKCSHYILATCVKAADPGGHPDLDRLLKRLTGLNRHISEAAAAKKQLKGLDVEPGKVLQVLVDPCRDGQPEPALARYGHRVFRLDPTEAPFHVIGGYNQTRFRDGALVVVDGSGKVAREVIVDYKWSMFPALCHDGTGSSREVFVHGGRAGPSDAGDMLVKVDPRSGSVEEVVPSEGGGGRPEARWRHTLTRVDDRQLVLVGGRNRDSVFSDIMSFDLVRKRWCRRFQLPFGLHSHSACFHGGLGVLVITGGLDHAENVVDALVVVDLAKKRRRDALKVFRNPANLLPRFSHTSHTVMPNLVLLVGGVSTHEEPGLAVVDLDTLRAEEYGLRCGGGDAAGGPLLYNHGSLMNLDDAGKPCELVIVGGGSNCFSFGMHLNRTLHRIDLTRLGGSFDISASW